MQKESILATDFCHSQSGHRCARTSDCDMRSPAGKDSCIVTAIIRQNYCRSTLHCDGRFFCRCCTHAQGGGDVSRFIESL